jgi:hypothetical protein
VARRISDGWPIPRRFTRFGLNRNDCFFTGRFCNWQKEGDPHPRKTLRGTGSLLTTGSSLF